MDEFFKWSGRFDALVGLVGAVVAAIFSVLSWRKAKQIRQERIAKEELDEAQIRLVLEADDDRQLELPYRPRRDQVSRAELLGILGVYGGKERFEPLKVAAVFESGEFDRMLEGKTNLLRIECAIEAFDQIKRNLDERRSS